MVHGRITIIPSLCTCLLTDSILRFHIGGSRMLSVRGCCIMYTCRFQIGGSRMLSVRGYCVMYTCRFQISGSRYAVDVWMLYYVLVVADWRFPDAAGAVDVAWEREIWSLHQRVRRLGVWCSPLGDLQFWTATILRSLERGGSVRQQIRFPLHVRSKKHGLYAIWPYQSPRWIAPIWLTNG